MRPNGTITTCRRSCTSSIAARSRCSSQTGLPIFSARGCSPASMPRRYAKSGSSALEIRFTCARVARVVTSAATAVHLRVCSLDLELTGKTFLITGGSSGLGLALAHRLVQEKAHGIALMARDSDRLAGAASELRKAGGDVLEFAGDVRDAEDGARFIATCTERWGRIDGLANNAGELSAGPFEGHDDTVWEEDLSLKLMGAIRLTRSALPFLREVKGAVLNTLAISGKAPDALTTPTSVSRAAGLALTKALSRELGSAGVRVNAVMIG